MAIAGRSRLQPSPRESEVFVTTNPPRIVFGPASVVASFRRAVAIPATKDANCPGLQRLWHRFTDAVPRVVAGCFDGAMLLGLVYIAVRAALLVGKVGSMSLATDGSA